MATLTARALAGIACTLCTLLTVARATPAISFPFNSQVPSVARVNEPYNFQFSDSTFSPTSTNFTYSVSNQPAWLLIDSATRTLSGKPGQGDAGSSAFTLTAADDTGAAHMQATLVVSSDPAPRLSGDISEQLAKSANLSSSQPPVVTLLPSSSFKFDFQQESFIDVVQRKLYFYATLVDHTPLPSWLTFDPTELTFSGVAPELSAFPQSWSIDLIASDVEGFAGTTASFTVAIGIQQLAFVPEEQDVNVTAGREVSFDILQHQLFRNGVELRPGDWEKAETSPLPSWLTFEATTLSLKGTAPDDITEQNVTVSVTNKMGNSASAVVNFIPGNATFFEGQVGTVVARAGEEFSYHFADSLFSQSDPDVTVAIPESAGWLVFDSASRTLSGDVPSFVQEGSIRATLTVKPEDGGESQSQVFTIDVKAVATMSTSSSPGQSSATNSPTSTPAIGATSTRSSNDLSGGIIAAIVILSLAAAALLLFCLIWCLRRRKRQAYEMGSPAPSKKSISRPIPPTEGGAITVTTEVQRDVEKDAESDVLNGEATVVPTVKENDQPPQISLTIPSHSANRRSKWSKRFSRVSLVSSIGVGEDAIKADSNIPEWGQNVTTLHTPHDSFAIPADMARVSRQLSQTSPAKRALRRLREKHRSQDSTGLGITTVTSGGIPRHSSKRTGRHRRGRSSFGGVSTTREASSMASFSTRGTSVLSTKASEFPMPPLSSHSMSLSVPTLSVYEADPKRKSIRLVERSDSVATDTRPIQDKRQSFIRNRASTARIGVQSPLFAHGSRASLNNGIRSANGSSTGSVKQSRRSKHSKSMLTTFSESSSLEPQAMEIRRSQRPQPRESKRFSQRLRTAFPPDYPRTVNRESSSDFTTTSESMNSEDWIRTEMAKPRHERSFVLPGEASPTPPPAPPTSRQQSVSRHSTPPADSAAARKQWRGRLGGAEKSTSPLSSQVQLADRSSPAISRKFSQARRNRLIEPISLVSADSIHNKARPRIAHTNSKRPVSVEEAQSLSSMKAEQDTATTGGSEQWDDIDDSEDELREAGLAPKGVSGGSRISTMKSARSDLSGPAFL